jgi:hypothetical protein
MRPSSLLVSVPRRIAMPTADGLASGRLVPELVAQPKVTSWSQQVETVEEGGEGLARGGTGAPGCFILVPTHCAIRACACARDSVSLTRQGEEKSRQHSKPCRILCRDALPLSFWNADLRAGFAPESGPVSIP